MKILHICLGNYFSDGYTYQDNMLPKYHVLQGHEVMVIAPRLSFNKEGKWEKLPEEDYITKDGFRLLRIDYKSQSKCNIILRRHKGFNRIVKEYAPEVIFVHNLHFMDVLYLPKYKRQHPEVKIYVDNHVDWINSMNNRVSRNLQHGLLFKYYAQKLVPVVEKFYGVLPVRCKFLNEIYGIPMEKIEYLPLGVDDEKLKLIDRDANRISVRKELGIEESDFVIVSGGKINKLKNFHLLLQAVSENKHTNLKLILFGSIADNFKEEFEHYLGDDRIKFVGWQQADAITRFILASDLAVMPGTHSVIWEEIVGCGVPALFKHYEGMHHVDVGGNCRFLHEDSPEEINKYLDELMDNPDIYNEMKNVALTEGRKKFSYSEISKRAINSTE